MLNLEDMTDKKNKRGGKRAGAGRKPYITDKKVQLPVYFLQSEIDILGREKIRVICKKAVEIACMKS